MEPEPPTAAHAEGVITRYARAWQDGDLETLAACYHDDVVAHYGGRSPFAGTHRGRDRFLAVLLETATRSDRRLVSIDQVHDDGDCGAIFATESFAIAGERHELARALRYRVAEGRIAECWLYDQEQHLVDLAWADPGPPA